MARYIENLNECTDPVSNDWLLITDTSAAATDKDRKVAAGLVPWTNSPSIFTRSVSVAPSVTGDTALNADMPTNTTGRAVRWTYATALRGYIQSDAVNNMLMLSPFDNGASVGTYVSIGNNNNAATPAAGFLLMSPMTGTARRLWVSAAGDLRIHTANPTNANDAAGTVVGAQTSSLDAKDVLGDAVDGAQALLFVKEGAAAVRRFRYKDGNYGGEEFSGLVVDYAPRYGMDRDEAHPAGKSLNVINAIGDLMLAVTYLAQRLDAMGEA